MKLWSLSPKYSTTDIPSTLPVTFHNIQFSSVPALGSLSILYNCVKKLPWRYFKVLPKLWFFSAQPISVNIWKIEMYYISLFCHDKYSSISLWLSEICRTILISTHIVLFEESSGIPSLNTDVIYSLTNSATSSNTPPSVWTENSLSWDADFPHPARHAIWSYWCQQYFKKCPRYVPKPDPMSEELDEFPVGNKLKQMQIPHWKYPEEREEYQSTLQQIGNWSLSVTTGANRKY